MDLTAPDDAGRAERLRHRRERVAKLRQLVDEHAALLHELQDLHAHYLELQRQQMKTAKVRVEQSEILSAEVQMVERTLELQRTVHDLLSEDQRLQH